METFPVGTAAQPGEGLQPSQGSRAPTAQGKTSPDGNPGIPLPSSSTGTHISTPQGPHHFQLQHGGKSQPAAKAQLLSLFFPISGTLLGCSSGGRRQGRGGMSLLPVLSIPPPSRGCIPADVRVDRAALNKPRTWGIVSSCAQLVQLVRFTAALRGSSAPPVHPACPKHEVNTSSSRGTPGAGLAVLCVLPQTCPISGTSSPSPAAPPSPPDPSHTPAQTHPSHSCLPCIPLLQISEKKSHYCARKTF